MQASLGHDFPFGFTDLPVKDRLLALKDAGFGDIMIHWQEENGRSACAQYDEATRLGLQLHTVHFPQEQMADLWRDDESGDILTERMIVALREIGERRIEHMVMHTTRGLITPPPSEIGIRRMRRVCEAAEKYGVNIAVENTRFLQYNQYLYDRIDSPRLRFCFDCGHANCYTPGEDPLGRFGDHLVTIHLHDNHGTRDEHMLIGEGSINLRAVFLRLYPYHLSSYNLESRYHPADPASAWSLETYLEKAVTRLRAYIRQAEEDFRAGIGVEDILST